MFHRRHPVPLNHGPVFHARLAGDKNKQQVDDPALEAQASLRMKTD